MNDDEHDSRQHRRAMHVSTVKSCESVAPVRGGNRWQVRIWFIFAKTCPSLSWSRLRVDKLWDEDFFLGCFFCTLYKRLQDLCEKNHANRSCNRCFGPFQTKKHFLKIPFRKFPLQICSELCDLNKADFASDAFVEIFAFLDNHGNLRVPNPSRISAPKKWTASFFGMINKPSSTKKTSQKLRPYYSNDYVHHLNIL